MAATPHINSLLAQAPDPPPELERKPLVQNLHSFAWISDKIAGVAEGKTPGWWWWAFLPSVAVMSLAL